MSSRGPLITHPVQTVIRDWLVELEKREDMKKPECKTYPRKVIGVINQYLEEQKAFKATFEKYVKVTVSGDLHNYDCIKGLWAVSCADKDRAHGEAINYFAQYYKDGEYDETD